MNNETRLNRLEFLKNKHKHQHNIVESLVAEKAPELTIKRQKQIKLSIKDEISAIETILKAEGVNIG